MQGDQSEGSLNASEKEETEHPRYELGWWSEFRTALRLLFLLLLH